MLATPDLWWPVEAARLVARLQAAAGHLAVRIDHIGSTSVPDLPAKDLVDIQVVVTDLSVAREAGKGARRAGLVPVGVTAVVTLLGYSETMPRNASGPCSGSRIEL
jgi:GrpB-like predicted nucleotidyltransferase (UPF0157 family)